MSNEKDLSTEVKTVLHGEVLGPEDETPKKSATQEKIEREAQYNTQQRYYSDLNSYYNQLRGQMGLYRSNTFGCLLHSPDGFLPCENCGQY